MNPAMYAIAAIGLLTIILSLIMIARPEAWSRGILRFAQKPYFHIAEIVSRLALGAVLLYFGRSTAYPRFFMAMGGVFVLAVIILIVAGSRRHREFALRSATFTYIFRPAGFAALILGAFIIYAAVAR